MVDNVDPSTVRSFGDEWDRFDQSSLPEAEAREIFEEYFAVFPWSDLPPNATGFDMGCGSGRWAKFVAPRVSVLHCIDPSSAIVVARKNLAELCNVRFHHAASQEHVLPSCSQDFGYSLGVLHHVPDTQVAIQDCVEMLKSGAPFLVYLYCAFDNCPWPYKVIWRCSDIERRVIYRLPPLLKHACTDLLAATGLTRIAFPKHTPCWCAVGFKG